MNEDSVVVPTAEANASEVLVLDTGICFGAVLTFDEVLLEFKDLILDSTRFNYGKKYSVHSACCR